MARIRTIKPEFPQSESMGRVSREARLTFVLLWTLADDAGRLRGNSRMLASLLFPYDDDAPRLIDGWLKELSDEGCVTRYLADGGAYVQIDNWLDHQKIDRPSESKIPPVSECSRILASTREPSSLDQGSRIKDQGEDLEAPRAPKAKTIDVSQWEPETEDRAYAQERGLDPDRIIADIRSWAANTTPAKRRKPNPRMFWQGWCRREADKLPPGKRIQPPPPPPTDPANAWKDDERRRLWGRIEAFRGQAPWHAMYGAKPGEPGCDWPQWLQDEELARRDDRVRA